VESVQSDEYVTLNWDRMYFINEKKTPLELKATGKCVPIKCSDKQRVWQC